MPIKTIEEVREYVQREYWTTGKISGYKNFHIDWHWNDRLVDALEQVYDFQNKRILDLGCAYGQVVASMIKREYDAFGIDLSDFAIAEGHKEYSPLKAKTIQGSIHDLKSYASKSFNFLYSNQVFEHVPSDVCSQLAIETFRVAQPGAILWSGLVLDMGNKFQPEGFNPEDPDKTHINIRPKIWWNDIFTKAGWIIDNVFDQSFRKHKLSDGYSFFEDYGWHSICYVKEIKLCGN